MAKLTRKEILLFAERLMDEEIDFTLTFQMPGTDSMQTSRFGDIPTALTMLANAIAVQVLEDQEDWQTGVDMGEVALEDKPTLEEGLAKFIEILDLGAWQFIQDYSNGQGAKISMEDVEPGTTLH